MNLTVQTDIIADYPTIHGRVFTLRCMRSLVRRKFDVNQVTGIEHDLKEKTELALSSLKLKSDEDPQFYLTKLRTKNKCLCVDLEFIDEDLYNKVKDNISEYRAYPIISSNEIAQGGNVINQIDDIMNVYINDLPTYVPGENDA